MKQSKLYKPILTLEITKARTPPSLLDWIKRLISIKKRLRSLKPNSRKLRFQI